MISFGFSAVFFPVWLGRLTLVFLLTMGVFGQGWALTEEETLRHVRQQLGHLRSKAATDSSRYSTMLEQVQQIDEAIAAAARHLQAAVSERDHSAASFAKLREDQQRISTQIASERAELAELVRAYYADGIDRTWFRFALMGISLNTLERNRHYMLYLTASQQTRLENLQLSLLQQQRQLAELAQRERHSAELEQAIRQQQQSLADQRQERSRLVVSLATQLVNERNEINRLRSNEARLASLLQQISKQSGVGVVRRDPERSEEDVSFAKLKGRLPSPVLARSMPKPNQQGMLFSVSAGTKVQAVATGRVVFADWLRGFGNLLIVDHGEGYMSVYGYNDVIHKRVGDTVRRGDVIAHSGDRGGNHDEGLYFQLRYQGKPLSVASWLMK